MRNYCGLNPDSCSLLGLGMIKKGCLSVVRVNKCCERNASLSVFVQHQLRRFQWLYVLWNGQTALPIMLGKVLVE
jgi:hypothetical protein